MAEGRLTDITMDFAVNIIVTVDGIRGHSTLVDKLERSATAIGAHIREIKHSHNRGDYAVKLQAALKECYETEYWLELIQKARLLPADVCDLALRDCGAIRRMLSAALKTNKDIII